MLKQFGKLFPGQGGQKFLPAFPGKIREQSGCDARIQRRQQCESLFRFKKFKRFRQIGGVRLCGGNDKFLRMGGTGKFTDTAKQIFTIHNRSPFHAGCCRGSPRQGTEAFMKRNIWRFRAADAHETRKFNLTTPIRAARQNMSFAHGGSLQKF